MSQCEELAFDEGNGGPSINKVLSDLRQSAEAGKCVDGALATQISRLHERPVAAQ